MIGFRHQVETKPRKRGFCLSVPRAGAVAMLSLILTACASTPNRAPESGLATCQWQPRAVKAPEFSLQPYNPGLPLRGQWRDDFDLADMNGDQRLDVVAGPARKGAPVPSIYFGDGSGRFRYSDQIRFPALPYDYGDAKVADFNGDGLNDIALGAHLRGTAVIIQDGPMVFAPWGEGMQMLAPADAFAAKEPVFGSRALAIADWNQDGRPDVIAANEGPALRSELPRSPAALRIWLNRNGYFETLDSKFLISGYSDSLAVGDANGDGQLDALVGSRIPGNRNLLQLRVGKELAVHSLNSLSTDSTVTEVAFAAIEPRQPAPMWVAERSTFGNQFCISLKELRLSEQGDQAELLLARVSDDEIRSLASLDLDADGQSELLVQSGFGGIEVLSRDSQAQWRWLMRLEAPPEYAGCKAYALKATNQAGPEPIILASYAGDTDLTSDALAPEQRCASGGGFAAWRVVRERQQTTSDTR